MRHLWFTDADLDSDADFEDAQVIVLAMRAHTMVNRLPPRELDGVRTQPPIPEIDVGPSLRMWCRPVAWRFDRDAPRTYELRTFSGPVTVRVVSGTIECLEASFLAPGTVVRAYAY